MNLQLSLLLVSGVFADCLIVCVLLDVLNLAKSSNVSRPGLKLGLRKTYCQLVDPTADDALADQPNDLRCAAKRLIRPLTCFLWLKIAACLCMLALIMGWIFENSSPALLNWSRVIIACDYGLTAFSILLICAWQSLNMRSGKRLKTMRELVNLISLINEQATFENYHQPLRRALVEVATLPEASFQSFWQQFNERGELLGRLTVLQHVLQQDNLDQLLKENADLANEVSKTIQALLDVLTSGLNEINDVQRQAAEQSRKQQSNQLLDEFKAVAESKP